MKVRVLQIGHLHDHAKVTFECMQRHSDLFEVVGLADEEPQAAQKCIPSAPAYYTIEEALKLDVDAVAIECEEEKATEYALLFAQKGVHIHLDKPGSQDVQAFHRLVDTARKNRLVLQLGYMYRYNPAVMDALQAVRSGTLGEIFSVEAQMSVRHDRVKREWLKKYKGGMLYFLGCHLIDLVLQICGTPEQILPMNSRTGTEGVESEDYGFVVFRYKNGVSFVKSCASEYNGFARRQLVITGTKGTVEIKPLEVLCGPDLYTPMAVTLEENNPAPWADCAVASRTECINRYDIMMRDFAQCVRGEKENPYTYEYEMQLFDTVMYCCGVTD